MSERNTIIGVTFGLFMIEAIMHYNQGKSDTEKQEQQKGFLPPPKSLLKLALIVGAFSVLNGVIIKKLK